MMEYQKAPITDQVWSQDVVRFNGYIGSVFCKYLLWNESANCGGETARTLKHRYCALDCKYDYDETIPKLWVVREFPTEFRRICEVCDEPNCSNKRWNDKRPAFGAVQGQGPSGIFFNKCKACWNDEENSARWERLNYEDEQEEAPKYSQNAWTVKNGTKKPLTDAQAMVCLAQKYKVRNEKPTPKFGLAAKAFAKGAWEGAYHASEAGATPETVIAAGVVAGSACAAGGYYLENKTRTSKAYQNKAINRGARATGEGVETYFEHF